MTEWKTYRLGDVANISTGFPFKGDLYSKDGVRVLRGENIGDEELRWDGHRDKRWNLPFERANEYLLQDGDVILAMDGNVGKNKVRITNQDLPMLMAQRVACIRANALSDQKFLYYAIISRAFQQYLDSVKTGTTIQHISMKQIADYEISLPGLEEQRRIAGILGAIDDKIENNRRINTNLELQAQALFEEWIGKSKTSKGVFNDIIQTTLAGDWGQETTQGNYTHEVYCIRGADIPTLQSGDKGKMPIRYILEKNYKTKQLRANDLVIEISGGSPTQSTGRICMITQSLLDRLGKDVVCTNFCRAITPKNGYAIYTYLYWQMLYRKNTMFSYENGTTGIKNLNIGDLLSKEPIEIPTQEDVEKLNIVLQPIYDKIYANGLQNETLATLRDTLLPKLMNNEIKVAE